MKSPFPGMDPYLEWHWRDVHTSLMVYARDQIQEQLPEDLLARVEENVAIDFEEARRSVSPDVRVVEEPTGTVLPPVAVQTTALAEPLVIPIEDEPATERHIEIIDPGSGNRVITAIEILSPSNKISVEGWELYRRKQREYQAGGVNLVEIDLIRDGAFVLAVPLDKIAAARRTPYMVCVRRAWGPRQAEVYPIPLREPLPTIRIPLRSSDADVTLNLHELLEQAYRRGRYGRIDYRQDLQPPLPPEDAGWADELLRAKGLR